MKIIKPLRLSVSHRPWRWQGRDYLAVCLMALTDMGSRPQLRPEPELWQLLAEELPENSMMMDLTLPKPCAEFLASGYGWTRHQPDKNHCLVKIQLGCRQKSLAVFGDRHWLNGRASEAQPFDKMPLGWQQAFGGPHCADNPLGIGAKPVQTAGGWRHPLPNVELPHDCLTRADQRPTPASFGPRDFRWPARAAYLGQGYHQRWLEHGFPGFSEDMDLRLLNLACEDQWWPHSPALPAQAPWRIWNMHPERQLQQGCLPPWRARCFINRGDDQASLQELELHASTVWFFPHREQMILYWHGGCPISQDDAADVHHLLAAMEFSADPRPVAHYQQVWQQRGDKAQAAVQALCEQQLVAPSLIGPWLDSQIRTNSSPLADALERHHQQLRARYPQAEPPAQPIHGALPHSPESIDDLPAFISQLAQQAAWWQQQARQKTDALHAERPAGPAPIDRQPLRRPPPARHTPAAAGSPDPAPGALGAQLAAEDDLHQLYLLAAGSGTAAPALRAQDSDRLRQQLAARMALDRDCRDLDLTGADLSGMDLRQGDFRRAQLESTILNDCRLDGADLSQAILAHASLHHASLEQVNLSGASLAGADCRHSRFSAALLHSTLLTGAKLVDCCFDRAQWHDLLVQQAHWQQCRLHHAQIKRCVFIALNGGQMDWQHSVWQKTLFIRGSLPAVNWSDSQLEDCAFLASDLCQADFSRGRLDSCVFADGTVADLARFAQASLVHCNLRATALAGSDFQQARLDHCDFSQADLSGAGMDGLIAGSSLFIRSNLSAARLAAADLRGALLQKSQLSGADLRLANLFRADLSQATIDTATQLQHVYSLRCKTLPNAVAAPQ